MQSRNFETGEEFEAFHDRFFEFEKADHIWNLSVGGVYIWRWIRKRVHVSIINQLFDRNDNSSKLEYRKHNLIEPGLHWLYSLLFKNPFFGGDCDVVFIGRERRKLLDDGYWWDIHCDTIYDCLDLDYIHLEYPHEQFGERHRKPAKTPKVYYLETIEYAGTVQRLLNLTSFTLRRRDKIKLARIESEIQDIFGVDVDVVQRAEKKLQMRKTTKWIYERFLDRVEPDLAVIAKGPSEEVFVEVCRELNITTVGIQHGIVDRYHLGYSHPGELEKAMFPDHFFFWGEYWKNAVELPIAARNQHCIGYPFIEQQGENIERNGRREAIIFLPSIQYCVELSRLAVELADVSDSKLDIIFKLHPRTVDDWERKLPWLKDSSILVADESDKTLYQYLAGSRAQVGVKSTALYEGLYFDLDTFLLDLPEVVRMNPLIERGGAVLVQDAEELYDYLSGRCSSDFEFNSEQVFRENATERMVEKLDELR